MKKMVEEAQETYLRELFHRDLRHWIDVAKRLRANHAAVAAKIKEVLQEPLVDDVVDAYQAGDRSVLKKQQDRISGNNEARAWRAAYHDQGNTLLENIPPKMPIRYVYRRSGDVAEDQKLIKYFEESARQWEKHTCVRFKELNFETETFQHTFSSLSSYDDGNVNDLRIVDWKNSHPNEQLFEVDLEKHGDENKPDCHVVHHDVYSFYYSSLSLAGCIDKKTPHAGVHELGHLLGLKHTHQRYDRDQYIYMNKKHVNRVQSLKLDHGTAHYFDIPYDYKSVMSYYPVVYRDKKDGTNGLLEMYKHHYVFCPGNPGALLYTRHGQEKTAPFGFSELAFINKLYCTDECLDHDGHRRKHVGDCLEWKNVLDLRELTREGTSLREQDLIMDHCRNPDNDPKGSWCFEILPVENQSVKGLMELKQDAVKTTKPLWLIPRNDMIGKVQKAYCTKKCSDVKPERNFCKGYCLNGGYFPPFAHWSKEQGKENSQDCECICPEGFDEQVPNCQKKLPEIQYNKALFPNWQVIGLKQFSTHELTIPAEVARIGHPVRYGWQIQVPDGFYILWLISELALNTDEEVESIDKCQNDFVVIFRDTCPENFEVKAGGLFCESSGNRFDIDHSYIGGLTEPEQNYLMVIVQITKWTERHKVQLSVSSLSYEAFAATKRTDKQNKDVFVTQDVYYLFPD